MNKFMTENTEHSNEHVYFINQLYRDFLLPTILGNDNASIFTGPANELLANMI